MSPAASFPPTDQTLTRSELYIYGHSELLYWWPVWAVGFLMALWTYLDHSHMALVPEGTQVVGNTLVTPPGTELGPLGVYVARSTVPGVVFVLTLLTVVIMTHLWLRGPWALFLAAAVAALFFLVGWLAWWGPFFEWVRLLRIHINLGGYLVLSLTLLAVWALAVFVIDRQVYLIFSVGQVRVRNEFGAGEKVFDTAGVTFEKRPYDWFRFVVGLGAGDMIIRTGGPNPRVFELPNVVRAGKWQAEMEARLRTRDVQ